MRKMRSHNTGDDRKGGDAAIDRPKDGIAHIAVRFFSGETRCNGDGRMLGLEMCVVAVLIHQSLITCVCPRLRLIRLRCINGDGTEIHGSLLTDDPEE